MKYKIATVATAVLAAAVIGWLWWGHAPTSSLQAPARQTVEAVNELGAAAKEKDNAAAEKYITAAANNGVLLNANDPAAKNEITQWEQRILSFAQEQKVKNANPAQIHALAVKTTDLFYLLKEASTRQKQGLEPYTSQTGFTTMTLVMTMEKEFQETLGVTFSDFLNSLDKNLIKRLSQ